MSPADPGRLAVRAGPRPASATSLPSPAWSRHECPGAGILREAREEQACAPEAKPRAPPEAKPRPRSSRQECWARDWERERAGCEWTCARAPGEALCHLAWHQLGLAPPDTSSPERAKVPANQRAVGCTLLRQVPPRLASPRRSAPPQGSGWSWAPDPNREEAGSSQLPPLDWAASLQSLQYPISIFSAFSASLTAPLFPSTVRQGGNFAVIFPALSGGLTELENTVRRGLIEVQDTEKTTQRRGPLGLRSSPLREDVRALI